MIFWTGKWLPFLAGVVKVENICVTVRELPRVKSYACLFFYLQRGGILGVLKRMALLFPDRMEVYVYSHWSDEFLKEKKPEFSLPVVSEFEPIDDYPDEFGIETEDIDLLRELIARGKKVSWILPNLVKFAHIIPQLKFEHIVINPFTENDLVLPTGEYQSNFFSKETMKKDYFLLLTNKLPFAKLLGFSMKELARSFDSRRYYQNRRRMGLMHKTPKRLFVGNYFAAAYYNILSITYMLCKKSFVTSVKKRNVPKG